MPVWASLLAWPILGERPNLLRVISLVMAFAGLAAIMGGNGFAASGAKMPGIIMALGGAFGFAVGTVLAKKLPLAAAAFGRRLADRNRLPAGGGRRPPDREVRRGGLVGSRLDPAGLRHGDPVLRCLCQLVRGAFAAAGLGCGDRHHGGACHRRGGGRRGAGRAAR